MAFLKKRADYLVDTSRMLTRELRAELHKIFVENQAFKNLYITVLSFGFKYGIPGMRTSSLTCASCPTLII